MDIRKTGESRGDEGTWMSFESACGRVSATVISYDDGDWMVERLDVAEGHRGQGLGKTFWGALMSELRVYAWSLVAETEEAKNFWLKLGFDEDNKIPCGEGQTSMAL